MRVVSEVQHEEGHQIAIDTAVLGTTITQPVSDIFGVSPPPWLQELTHSESKGLLGKAAGELVAGGVGAAITATSTTEREGEQRNWFQLLPQSITEAKMSLVDPMWRIKLQQTQVGIAQTALGLQETQQRIDLNKTKIALTAEDNAEIPAWLREHPTVESRMTAEWPAAKTSEWNNNLNQLRARDSQSTLAKATVSGLKELSDAVNEISLYDGVKAGELSAKIQPFAIKGQMPPPELTAQVMTARGEAEAKKFERTKELYGVKGTGQPVAQKYLRLADQEDELAEDFRLKGDTAAYQEHSERAKNYRTLAAPKTSTTEVSFDASGKPVVTQSYGAAKPTTAMSTRAQQKTVQFENALTLINKLEEELAPADVGAAGLLGEMVLDRTLAQFNPKFANKERIDKRTALGALRESLLREVSDDPRFSNVDRDAISRLLPSTGVFESYPDAIQRMGTLKGILRDRIGSYAGSTGSPAPASVKAPAQLITDYNAAVEALSQSVKDSKLTPQQAYEQAQQLHKQLTETLQRFH